MVIAELRATIVVVPGMNGVNALQPCLVGKQLSKAVFTSTILCAVVYLLGYVGYTVICITAAALLAYIPLVIVLLILWYLIGRLL